MPSPQPATCSSSCSRCCCQEPTCQQCAAFACWSTASAAPRWRPAWTTATRSSDGPTLPTSGPWGAGPLTLDSSLTFFQSLHTLLGLGIRARSGIKKAQKSHFTIFSFTPGFDTSQTDVTRYFLVERIKNCQVFGKVFAWKTSHGKKGVSHEATTVGVWWLGGAGPDWETVGSSSKPASPSYSSLHPSSITRQPKPPNSRSMGRGCCRKVCGRIWGKC